MKRVYVDPTDHLDRASLGDFAGPDWHDLALTALRLRREGPKGELVALGALPPARPPAEHQIAGAVAIVERAANCALLADDEALDPVGTAALVVREWAVRYDARTLILVPASRISPWRRALSNWSGKLAPVLALHQDAERMRDRTWDNVVVDGAHALIEDGRIMVSGRRRLLVTSTPVRTGMQDLIPVLGALGATPDPAGLRRHAIRRRAPLVPRTVLAEIVRLEASEGERRLLHEACDLAVSVIPQGGPSAGAWRRLLQAALCLPQAPLVQAGQILGADPDPLARARILSLLKTAQACSTRSPGKLEALVSLVSGARGASLVCVATPEIARWINAALAARGLDVGPQGQVWALSDGEASRCEPRGFTTAIHVDVPWDPRVLAERLSRLDGASELRSFHLALAGTIDEVLLDAYQGSLALAAPLGRVAGAIAEAPDDPEVAVGAALVAGLDAFGGWAETLADCLTRAGRAQEATERALGGLDLLS